MPKTAKAPKTAKKTSSTTKAPLPAALAKRAGAAATAKTARLVREARGHLALIARRKSEITEAFYDIGVALTWLKSKEVVAALGRKSFAEVCEKDAGMSASTAERLVGIVAGMTRDDALSMGQTKASAMVSLAAATKASDTAAGLFRKKSVALPGGKKIVPRTASALAIEAAAVALRQKRAAGEKGSAKRGRGRTTTEEERALATMLTQQLHKLGLDRARVTAVATKPGQGADLRFERIPAAKVDLLKKAIGR
jgi:uncharacterized protein YjiS (DUF1127 family)